MSPDRSRFAQAAIPCELMPSALMRRRLTIALVGGFAAIWFGLFLLFGMAMLTQWTHNRADSRCSDAQPGNAWGYTIEWDWEQRAYICDFQGRDYSFTGDRERVTLSDL
jgi:hypothetical protein